MAGLTLLGDADPRITREPGGDTRSGSESRAEVADRLAETACAENSVDVLVANEPSLLDPAVERGCAELALAGGIERGYEVVTVEGRPVPRYLALSAGGATYEPSADNALSTLGPLRVPAEITLLTFGRDSRRLLRLDVIVVGPDRSVEIEPAIITPYGRSTVGRRELATTTTTSTTSGAR
jgi:hypothetical protein